MLKQTKVALGALGVLAFFMVAFDHKGITAVDAKGFGYGYGYGNKVDISYKGGSVSKGRTTNDSIKVCFKKTDKTAYYLKSKSRDFDGATWKSLSGDKCIRLNVNDDFNGKRTRYYFRFKDEYGAISQKFTKTVIFKKVPKTSIRVSGIKFNANGSIIFRGRGFSKNGEVGVYFSNQFGKFGAPVKVGTDKFGNFKLSHNVGWTKGAFSWYAVNLRTGKTSRTINYSVI